MQLTEFLDLYRAALADAVTRTYPPVYDVAMRQRRDVDLRRLLRRPLGAQADAIRATALALQQQGSALVVGEMGTGKSYIAAAAAYLAGYRRVLVLAPPHLVKKWRREIQQTIPGAQVLIVRTIGDLERARSLGGGLQFVVCSREQAKLGYRWRAVAVERWTRDEAGYPVRDETGSPRRRLCCPTCFAPLTDDEGVPVTWGDLEAKKGLCPTCQGPLWQADRAGPRRYPLADYVRRRMRGYFELLIGDECHEFKARGSAQGIAAGTLADACQRTLALSGTIFNGYSSSLFYLLWRFSRAVRLEFGYRDEARWVSRYGVLERITKKDADAYADDGRQSKRRSYYTRTVERPGVSPLALFHLIGNTVFLRLADVAHDLPPYQEQVVLYPLDEGEGEEQSQARCYRRLAEELRHALLDALRQGSKRLLATYLQALLSYPDACTRGETVLDPRTGDVLAYAPPLPQDTLYPKERALVDLVQREQSRGRRVLLYITHTETRDISPRLKTILDRAGVRSVVLKANTVAPDRREEWVAARVSDGLDVLITHPRLVATGLDLVAFQTVVWLEIDYSVYVLRQASRRVWRIGQDQPVEVVHLVYQDTLQAEALALVAAKMRSALMVEGELPEDGLAALEGDGQEMVLALARQFTAGSGQDGQSLEALFTQAQAVEAEANDYLVEGEWATDDACGVEAVSAPRVRLDNGAAGDAIAAVWDQVLRGQPAVPGGGAAPPARDGNGRVMSFEELAELVQRRRPRRRGVPEGQLALF